MKKVYFKKTLSLFMAVMMLLSCWVFVAPTEAEAAVEVSYQITLGWNFNADSRSGHIAVSYYKFRDDGKGIDLNAKVEKEALFNSFGDYAKGAQTQTFTINGFPYELYYKNNSSGSKGGTLEVQSFKIGTKTIFSNDGWDIDKGEEHTFSLAGAGADNSDMWGTWLASAKANWSNPVPTSWYKSLEQNPSLNVPKTGSVTKSFAASAVDQYGVAWYKAPQYSLSSTTGVSIDASGTFAATIASLHGNNGYNASTGKATVNLTANFTNYDTSWTVSSATTITLVSPKYTVSFLDGNGASFGTAQTCNYNDSVSYPTGTPTKTEDDTYHYTFNSWPENQNTNITADKSIVATFNNIKHEFSGQVVSNNDGTHKQQCIGCSKYGWGLVTGETQDCKHDKDAWTQSTDGGTHYNTCSVAGCGYTINHSAVWVQNTNVKYAVPGTEQGCESDGWFYESCEVCGVASTTRTFIGKPATGHDFVYGQAGQSVPHTCDADGYVPYSCGNGCGAVRNEIYLRDDNYEYDDSQVVVEDGIRYVIDADGNKVYFDKRAHDYSPNITKKDDSEHGRACSRCDSWTDVTAHVWTLQNTITPQTCIDDGLGEYTCSCGASKTDVIPADGTSHKYLDPVSDGNGNHVATCDYCKDEIKEACFDEDSNCLCDVCSYQFAHVYDQELVNKDTKATDADCYNAATYYYSCKCGLINKADGAATFSFGSVLPHVWQNTKNFKVSDPDCDNGTVYYKECLRCHDSSEGITDATWEDSDKLGHNFTGKVKDNGNGTHSFACLNGCGEYGATVKCEYGAYTNGNDGYHYRYCGGCNHEEKQAHQMTAWAPVDPDSQEKSSQSRHCQFCDYAETTECTYVETVSPATCIKAETTTYACPECGHGFTKITGDKIPHQYNGEYMTDDATHKHTQRCTVANGCNDFNPEWTDCSLSYAQKEGDVHGVSCDVCQYTFVDEDCSGGTAYCNALAICSKCQDTYGDYAPHDFSGAVQNVTSGKHNYKCLGCDNYGVGSELNATEDCSGGTAYCDEQAICEICNTYYGEFDPDSHKSTTKYDGLEPTCMKEGYTAYEVCNNDACNAVLGKDVIPVNPDAHAFDTKAYEHEDNAEDYGTEPGKHYYKCLNEDVDGNQCTVVDVKDCVVGSTEVVPPTCLEVGYTRNFCGECGYEWRTDYTEATDHDWGEWINNEGTETHTKTCKNDPAHKETTNCADSATYVVTPPTCTEKGFTTYTCTLCGHVWVGEDTYVDELGHDYTEKIIDKDHEHSKVATCTNAQYYWYDCSRCDKNAKDETDNVKYPADSLYYENGTGEGHTWNGKAYIDEAVLATPATCDKNATYYTYCTVCHLSSKGVEGVEATFEHWGSLLSHDFQEIVDKTDLEKNRVSAATCTAKAVYNKSCKNCGEVNEDETFTYGEFLAHVYTKEVKNSAHKISDATCTSKASYWYNCENCNSNAKLIDKSEMTEEEIAALKYETGDIDEDNHTALEKFAVKNPTCLEAGHSAYEYCSDCDTTLNLVTKGYEKKEHVFKGVYVEENTTDADGNTVYQHKRACSYNCGTYSAVSACTFGRAVQNEDGKTHTKKCVCGNSITSDCVAKENATCVSAATCKECNSSIEGTLVGHKYPDTWTSSNDGKTHYRVCENDPSHIEREACSGGDATGCGAVYCSICNQNYSTATNHKWGEWEDTAAATCITPAKHKRTCTACGTTEEVSYGDVLGHDYDSDDDGVNDGTVTKEATCTESGIMTFKCFNDDCEEGYVEAIEPLGHKLADEWTIVKEATCKEEGEMERCCVNSWKDADGKEVKCDYKVTEYLPKSNDHNPGEWVQDEESAGNCSTGLTSYKYCQDCGELVDKKTEKIPHTWVEEVVVWGTCTTNGYIDMRCTQCNAVARFSENHPTFPNKFEDTEIIPAIAEKLLSKNGHTWRTEALEGETNYTTDKDGNIVYIDKAPSCSQTGRGYMICENCPERSATVTLPKVAHKLVTVEAKAPTCTLSGTKEYQKCTVCPYSETPEKVAALGHADTNNNGSCDRCGFEMYEKEDGTTSACGCMCHSKSVFIAKLIYPIARFFWKIFKTNHSCACGATHY